MKYHKKLQYLKSRIWWIVTKRTGILGFSFRLVKIRKLIQIWSLMHIFLTCHDPNLTDYCINVIMMLRHIKYELCKWTLFENSFLIYVAKCCDYKHSIDTRVMSLFAIPFQVIVNEWTIYLYLYSLYSSRLGFGRDFHRCTQAAKVELRVSLVSFMTNFSLIKNLLDQHFRQNVDTFW